MKPHHFIAPALALAGSGYWLYQQNDTIRELTEKTKVIKERVVVYEKAAAEVTVDLAPKKDKKQDEFTLPDGTLDWKLIAELMAETRANNGMPTDIKAMLKLQSRLMELTEEEIVAGLQKIATLDLDPKVVDMLKQGLLSRLAEQNPIAALEALGDPITDQSNTLYWAQTQIITKLAKEDPAKAIAWIDEQVENGKLQSTSLNHHQDPRLRLEGALFNQLMASDPDTAKKRLEVFNDEEKMHLLSTNHRHLKGVEAENYLKLTRESLPPEKASEAITSAFGNQYYDSLDKIGESIKDVSLTDGERKAVVSQMVGNYARNLESEDKFKEIYEWSKTEAPGQETSLVASALGNDHNRWNNPEASFKKALNVAESLQNPDIAIEFVSDFSHNGESSTVERQLSRFKDPDLAEKYKALVEALPQPSTDSE